jgi:hypothetical protein
MSQPVATLAQTTKPREAEVLEAVARSLAGLRFGTVQLTVHEGRVVQLDVTERQRFA